MDRYFEKSGGIKLYDISQEVFSCLCYPGDPPPRRERLHCMERGDLYNLTAFSMGAHNGTHIDAPRHFLRDGLTVDQLGLENFVGSVFVAEHQGLVSAGDARDMLRRGALEARRLLIKGDAVVSAEAARVFADAQLLLVGNESQSVGPEEAPMEVHLLLLQAGVALLEGVRLSHVPEGTYFLSAAPLNLGAAEGAPCRALLIGFED